MHLADNNVILTELIFSCVFLFLVYIEEKCEDFCQNSFLLYQNSARAKKLLFLSEQ